MLDTTDYWHAYATGTPTGKQRGSQRCRSLTTRGGRDFVASTGQVVGNILAEVLKSPGDFACWARDEAQKARSRDEEPATTPNWGDFVAPTQGRNLQEPNERSTHASSTWFHSSVLAT
jgi:hypothetical protein